MDDSKQQPPAAAQTPGDPPSSGTGYGTPPPAPTEHFRGPTEHQAVHAPIGMLPLVTALDAGRLWNRLRFHLEQAWFGYGNHRRAARKSLERLGRAVRNIVPAVDRWGFQQAVIRPFEELFHRIESEEHYRTYEGWTGEFANEHLTDEDFRWAPEPAFEAVAAGRRSIEERLDGLARLAFHLGELLDQGACPPNVHRHLGRPRPVHGRPEGKSPWGSVRPGEEAPDTGWFNEVGQLLIELAIGLGLAPDALPLDQVEVDEPIARLIERIADRVGTALTNSGGDAETDKVEKQMDELPTLSAESAPQTAVGSDQRPQENRPGQAGGTVLEQRDGSDEQAAGAPREIGELGWLRLDRATRTVTIQGREYQVRFAPPSGRPRRRVKWGLSGARAAGYGDGGRRGLRPVLRWCASARRLVWPERLWPVPW